MEKSNMLAIDKLCDAIKSKKNPTAVGLDTDISFLPKAMQEKCVDVEKAVPYIVKFNVDMIDALAPIVPAVKVQVAYYELLGPTGMLAFSETLKYAKKAGLITIADVKRNDIGSTAAAYSKAYLPNGAPFEADFITVNPYLGGDGIMPFVDDCKKYGKGLFVLCKTSNPGSGELQDKEYTSGGTLYQESAKLITKWGSELIGKNGYSSVAAVVGATHPAQAEQIRANHKGLFFLIPGYGAQGGSAKDIAGCFDKNGLGGIVNNSRGILTAHTKYEGMHYTDAAIKAATVMRDDLQTAIQL
jgi:orotidine-5'-phosphate decarboxylase